MERTIKNFRTGNIGVLHMNNDGRYACEIVCYCKNPYYGKEDGFIESPHDPDMLIPKEDSGYPGIAVSRKCFINEECCYVVAWMTDSEEPDIVSVGERPWDLDGEDKTCFEAVVKKLFAFSRGDIEDLEDSGGNAC